MRSILSIQSPCAPPHPSKHHVLHGSTEAPCAPSCPSRHHVPYLIHPSTTCSTASWRHHTLHLVHPGNVCSTAPSTHQEILVLRATVQFLPVIRGLGRSKTCPPDPGMARRSRAGPGRQIWWCSGNQSLRPGPQVVVSHLHQCNSPKPEAMRIRTCHCFSACS